MAGRIPVNLDKTGFPGSFRRKKHLYEVFNDRIAKESIIIYGVLTSTSCIFVTVHYIEGGKNNMLTLSGRTCVFAGATGNVGRGAIRALAEGGMNVVLVTHNPDSAAEIIERARRETGIDVDPFLKAPGQT